MHRSTPAPLLLLIGLSIAAFAGCVAETATEPVRPPIVRPDTCVRIPDGSLAAWWRFDNAGDSIWAIDGSSGRNHGLRRGGAGSAPGVFGTSAVNLDGIDEFIDVPDAPSLDVGAGDAFGLSFWLRLPSGIPDNVVTILDKRADGAVPTGYSLYLYNGRVGVQVADGRSYVNFNGPHLPSDVVARWVFVAVSVDRGQTPSVVWSIDGVSDTVAAPSMPSGSLANSAALTIGGSGLGSTISITFEGQLDELALYRGEIPAGIPSRLRATPLCY